MDSILTKNDIHSEDLTNVIIFNVFIERTDWYHHAKYELVANSFGNLEYFYDSKMETYNIYFTSYPSSWTMKALIEYMVIPEVDSGE